MSIDLEGISVPGQGIVLSAEKSRELDKQTKADRIEQYAGTAGTIYVALLDELWALEKTMKSAPQARAGKLIDREETLHTMLDILGKEIGLTEIEHDANVRIGLYDMPNSSLKSNLERAIHNVALSSVPLVDAQSKVAQLTKTHSSATPQPNNPKYAFRGRALHELGSRINQRISLERSQAKR